MSAAMNGHAGAAMAENDSAPPCSSRRARDWTAGAFAISANEWLAAVWTEFCAKRTESRSRNGFGQMVLGIVDHEEGREGGKALKC